jgi:desumoylating isopeptidase 1
MHIFIPLAILPMISSQFGRPLRVVELGESGIDEETFLEYINEMRSIYSADKYHLLDFNCNSFTNDCASFLTGGSIPSYIRSLKSAFPSSYYRTKCMPPDLPTDFLNTPFGQALRPTIDQMYRSGASPPVPPPSNQAASAILQEVAANANAAPSQANGIPTAQTLTGPIQICTNPTSFETIKQRHKAVIVFFTSQTCAPCKMVEPVFEGLAREKASPSIGFVKVDMSIGMGHQVGQYNAVYATPTFLFLLNGKKASCASILVVNVVLNFI